jgi:hypothetical protein
MYLQHMDSFQQWNSKILVVMGRMKNKELFTEAKICWNRDTSG